MTEGGRTVCDQAYPTAEADVVRMKNIAISLAGADRMS